MDFVEAVRLGCERTLPIHDGTLLAVRNGETIACVLGAAFITVLGPAVSDGDEGYSQLAKLFPVLALGMGPCPACEGAAELYPTRMDIAIHLNDYHKWDRLRTAHYIQEGA